MVSITRKHAADRVESALRSVMAEIGTWMKQALA